MPSIDYMRGEIAKVYPGVSWKCRVDRMSDGQVLRIFHRFKDTGKFDEYYDKKRKKTGEAVQLSFL